MFSCFHVQHGNLVPLLDVRVSTNLAINSRSGRQQGCFIIFLVTEPKTRKKKGQFLKPGPTQLVLEAQFSGNNNQQRYICLTPAVQSKEEFDRSTARIDL